MSPLWLATPHGTRASPPQGLGVATLVPCRRVFPPLAASGLEERCGAAGTAGLGLTGAEPYRAAPPERAEHMGDRVGSARCRAVAGGGPRPQVVPELWQREEEVGVLARPQPPLDLEAGARERVIVWLVMGHRCVQRGNRSPGCERGKRRPWHGGGCAPGPSSLARGPIFELWRRTVYFALQKANHVQSPRAGHLHLCFTSRSFIFVLAPEVVNENFVVSAFLEPSTEI